MVKSFLLKAKGLALAGIAGAMLIGGGLSVSTAPAEAGASTGTWKYGTPYRGAYRGGYAYRGGPRYYGRGYNRGGAVAAGVAGGLALGALGAAAAAPYYGYGSPAYGVAPAYGGDCYWTDRQAYDAWGRIVVQRVQVCD